MIPPPIFQFRRIPGVNPFIVLAVLFAPVIYVLGLVAAIVLVLFFAARTLVRRAIRPVRNRRLDEKAELYLPWLESEFADEGSER